MNAHIYVTNSGSHIEQCVEFKLEPQRVTIVVHNYGGLHPNRRLTHLGAHNLKCPRCGNFETLKKLFWLYPLTKPIMGGGSSLCVVSFFLENCSPRR